MFWRSVQFNMLDDQVDYDIEFDLIRETIEKPFTDLFLGYAHGDGLIQSSRGSFVMPASYAQGAEKVYRFEPRLDDTFIVTFPKSGIRPTHPSMQSGTFSC